MTKPESQNTGSDTMYPMIPIASVLLPCPVRRRIARARRAAPPEFSRNTPMIVPAMMTTPMLPMVLPKPSLTELTTWPRGMPESTP